MSKKHNNKTAPVAEATTAPEKKGVADEDLEALKNKAVELTKADKLKAAAKEALGYFPTETDCYVTEDGNVFLNRAKSAARFHAQQKNQQLYIYQKATDSLLQQ
jgi:hypothetical protein